MSFTKKSANALTTLTTPYLMAFAGLLIPDHALTTPDQTPDHYYYYHGGLRAKGGWSVVRQPLAHG